MQYIDIEAWINETLDLGGFGNLGVISTMYAHYDELREMVLSAVLSFTYPDKGHPYPEMLAGVDWTLITGTGEDSYRRLKAIVDLIENCLLVIDGDLLVVAPNIDTRVI